MADSMGGRHENHRARNQGLHRHRVVSGKAKQAYVIQLKLICCRFKAAHECFVHDRRRLAGVEFDFQYEMKLVGNLLSKREKRLCHGFERVVSGMPKLEGEPGFSRNDVERTRLNE